MKRDAMPFDLFLDESGTFMETSTSAGERQRAGRGRRFASQLAGVLVPRGELTRDTGRQALDRIFSRADLPVSETIHGLDLHAGPQFDRLIIALVDELENRGWQPVRLTNAEGVSFGDRVANYTNLVAELALRICRGKQRQGHPEVGLFLTCAVVKLGNTADDQPILLADHEYLDRLRELHARAAIHKGLAAESAGWRIGSFRTGSARSWPELMICDLVSNASHDGFSKLGETAQTRLSAAMQPWDFTLRVQELVERVDTLLTQQAFGPALVQLMTRAAESDDGGPLRRGIDLRLARVTSELAELGAPTRDPQLAMLLSYLQQMMQRRLVLTEGVRQVRWLSRRFLPRMREQLTPFGAAATLDWFEFGLQGLLLVACNHTGLIGDAKQHVRRLRDLVPSLTARFEHIDLALSGSVHEAAWRLAALDPESALAIAEPVAQFFDDLGQLFQAALEVFPERVQADLRGEALRMCAGAKLQQGDFERARELAQQAHDEFDAPFDKLEQLRYRARLEACAGDTLAARRYLAQGVGAEGDAHDVIADGINALHEDSPERGAALLEWLRIGVLEILADDGAEFRATLRRSKLESDGWCRRETGPYPRHGVLRRLATLQALDDRRDHALASLARLRTGVTSSTQGATVRPLILAAAQMETAAVLWRAQPPVAAKLIEGTERARPGAIAVLAQLRPTLEGFDGLIAMADHLAAACAHAVSASNDDAPSTLRAAAARLLF